MLSARGKLALEGCVFALKIVWGFLGFGGFLNLHIAELFGVKDLATLQALDILGVFVPGNDSYFGVFADGGHRFGIGWINCSFRQIVAVFSTIENVYLLNLWASGQIFCNHGAANPGRA
jgi:hypothetical protein